jgi:hypothetical protein
MLPVINMPGVVFPSCNANVIGDCDECLYVFSAQLDVLGNLVGKHSGRLPRLRRQLNASNCS